MERSLHTPLRGIKGREKCKRFQQKMPLLSLGFNAETRPHSTNSVERHQRRAYRYAFRLTRNPDEAADVVAESFLRVFRSISSFKGESCFTTWLYRVETNSFLEMRKKASSRPTTSLDEVLHVDDGTLELQIVDHREGAVEHVERNERMSVVTRAMKKLPEHQRAILVMYHAESMSYEDIAQTLRLPIGTVKSRLNRARLSLRDILRPCRNLFVIPNRRNQALPAM